MHNQFTVRKFTENKLETKPYEIVYVDYANNNLHSDPDLIFSTEVEAALVVNALNVSRKATNAKKWPIVGPIPAEMLQKLH